MALFEVKNDTVRGVMEHVSPYLHGKDEALIRVLVCVFSGGHILIEDLPGLGKTTLAVVTARVFGFTFGRVQCTNDLLPTDVTGLNVFRAERGEFEFHPGPIFNNLVLVDEINRASPKTQSALLESMGEEQATIDGITHRLAEPFIVMATQNPAEYAGTFPLPESQMDRFMMRMSIGYPDRNSERDILRLGLNRRSIDQLPPLFSAASVVGLQREIEHEVTAGDRILDYILSITEKTRSHPLVACGISTRGAMVLLKCARCVAWMRGRDFVVPEDVKVFAGDVLLHRMQFKDGSRSEGGRILQSIMDEVPALK
ncbi:MAG: MoxR family ATPase [Synergistaceae bacterium]|jgi:MoxR-like ATPase|nr:MoxR family ATPase [Synergistaceae bacterium]